MSGKELENKPAELTMEEKVRARNAEKVPQWKL
jgi:hypothetical protein